MNFFCTMCALKSRPAQQLRRAATSVARWQQTIQQRNTPPRLALQTMLASVWVPTCVTDGCSTGPTLGAGFVVLSADSCRWRLLPTSHHVVAWLAECRSLGAVASLAVFVTFGYRVGGRPRLSALLPYSTWMAITLRRGTPPLLL